MLAVVVVVTLLVIVGLGTQATFAATSKDDSGSPGPSVPYGSNISKTAIAYGIPVRLMVAVIAHESTFNPRAVNTEEAADKRLGRDVDSLGLCQILYPDTAQSLRPGITREDCFDVDTNLDMGCRVMSNNLRRYPQPGGFPEDAVSAYNAGHSTRRADGSFANQVYVNAVRAEWEKYIGL